MFALLAAIVLSQDAGVDAGIVDAGVDSGTLTFTTQGEGLSVVITAEVPIVFTDAGTLYGACVEAPPSIIVDGGRFLPTPRFERIACMLATCETQLKDTEERKEMVNAAIVAGVGTVGLVVGIGIGLLIPVVFPAKAPNP